MTTESFQASLSSEQTKALNELLVEQRDALVAQHQAVNAEVVAVYKQQIAEREEEFVASEKIQAEFDALQAKVTSGIKAIKEAVLNPDTPTESTVLAIIAEATKDERQRQSDALREQITGLQKQLDALA